MQQNKPTRIYEGVSDSHLNIQELLKAEIYNEKITPLSQNESNAKQSHSKRSQPNKPYSAQTYGVSDQYLILDTIPKMLYFLDIRLMYKIRFYQMVKNEYYSFY